MSTTAEIKRACEVWHIDAVVLDCIGSTNDYASAADLPHGSVVVALDQAAGRGQRGNRWTADPGANLTVSFILKPVFLPAHRQFLLSQAVSLAVADTLSEYGIAARVKWPNDIYVGDRKIAGILIENDIMGINIGRSIAGVGLNVNQTAFDPSLPNPTSMAVETGRSFSIADVLCTCHRHLSGLYSLLESGGADTINSRYDGLLYRKNERHLYRTPSGDTFFAVIERVMPEGELALRLDDGAHRQYLFKEVEYCIK